MLPQLDWDPKGVTTQFLVKDGVLRTPEARFDGLPGYPFTPHYQDVNGLRMHFVDQGTGDPILCLHGEPTWSYLYRKMIPGLSQVGRVIALDLIGFGKSDKHLEPGAYSFHQHLHDLTAFLAALDLREITLIGHDWGAMLGLTLAARDPERFARLVILNTGLPEPGSLSRLHPLRIWKGFAKVIPRLPIRWIMQAGTKGWLAANVMAAYLAPFPDRRFKAGARRFPEMLPLSQDDPGADTIREARRRLSTWEKPALVLFSDLDPFFRRFEDDFRRLIPGVGKRPEPRIRGAGHFLQEDRGEIVADRIQDFIDRTS